MKKQVFLLMFLGLTVFTFGQITLEKSYDYWGLKIAKISDNEYKYYFYENNSLLLFNLDHTEFKTIDVIQNSAYLAHYVSRNLFDSDDGIEFLVSTSNWDNDSIIVFDDDGSILFMADSCEMYDWDDLNKYIFEPIVTTPDGAKLIIGRNNKCNVYSLPGTSTNFKSLKSNNLLKISDPYPNPAKSEFTVDISLPYNISEGKIELIDIKGTVVEEKFVSKGDQKIIIQTSHLKSGNYICILRYNNYISEGKKIIIND